MDAPSDNSNVDFQLALASERTLLAWIRTGLAMMGFGFVVARFGIFLREIASTEHVPTKSSVHLSVWMGTVLVAIGVFVFLAASRDHARYLRKLRQGIIEPLPARSLGVLVGLSLAALGIAMVGYLILLALSG